MDFSDIYTQYIDDIKNNIQDFNNNEMAPFVQKNMPLQAKADIEEDLEKKDNKQNPDYVPFAMKLFQRRIQKFSSYKENQEYIKRQNSVLHLQQVKKVEKEQK